MEVSKHVKIYLVIIVILIKDLECASVVVRSIPPPVWEYSYQYELFEKILNETQELKDEMKYMSNRLFGVDTKCPIFWVPANGSCYHVQLGYKANWPEAQGSCEKIGSHLAILDTEEENYFLKDIVRNSGFHEELEPLWIGGSKVEVHRPWQWVDDSEVSYHDWAADKEEKHKPYLCLSWALNGWSMKSCKGKSYKFICERDAIQ